MKGLIITVLWIAILQGCVTGDETTLDIAQPELDKYRMVASWADGRSSIVVGVVSRTQLQPDAFTGRLYAKTGSVCDAILKFSTGSWRVICAGGEGSSGVLKTVRPGLSYAGFSKSSAEREMSVVVSVR